MSGERRVLFETLIAGAAGTAFRAITAALVAVIFGYTSSDDGWEDELVLAYSATLRRHRDEIGNFAAVLPLHVPRRADWTCGQYAVHIARELHAARDHRNVSVQDMLGFIEEKVLRQHPSFNVLVNESEGLLPFGPLELAGTDARLVEGPSTGGPFDLALHYSVASDCVRFSMDVPVELASHALLKELQANFDRTLDHFIREPDKPISEYGMVCSHEADAMGTIPPLPPSDVAACILDRAADNPDRVAVRFQDVRLTYQQIVGQASELARRVQTKVDPAVLPAGVGLSLRRSELLPVAMLTALLLGVPFVPLDEGLPQGRFDAMLAANGARVVLVDDADAAAALLDRAPWLTVIAANNLGGTAEALTSSVSVETPAYILFTSGSTGEPKGVLISRGNLANFMSSMESRLRVCADDITLALTPISFDISILELLLPLVTGGTVDIVDAATRTSARDLARYINSCGATVLQATPSTWLMLKHAGWRAERGVTLLTGGEALSPDLAAYLLEQSRAVHNMYGPTEATIWASSARVTDAGDILIGRPVFGTRFHVVDTKLRPVPFGMQGELVIEGDCVGGGYIRPDPAGAFVKFGQSGSSAYRTGDMVRCFGDGEIQYVGRVDGQCKVNGHRVELGAISGRLSALLGTSQVVTVVRERPSRHLCSFYVPATGTNSDPSQALRALKALLPEYMVPDQLLAVAKIPLTPNGKADLKRLATDPLSDIGTAAAAPAAAAASAPSTGAVGLEQLRARIEDWFGVVLPSEDVPLGALGFNSISYNLLSQRLLDTFGVEVPPHRFYAANDVRSIRAAIAAQGGATASTFPSDSGQTPNPAADCAHVAIVGYSVLMPGGMEAEGFWSALLDQRELVSEQRRRGFRAGYHAAFLDDVESFDARFFSVSPLEAHHMDPRQRMLLQLAWRAIEDAGYAPEALAGRRVGCYVAATGNDYATLQARAGQEPNPYSLPGSSLSLIANRISSFFDLKGASFTLDTACSGALSAFSKACRDVAGGVVDSALVGGVNLVLDDEISRGLKAGNFMSPHHRCAAFDADADGYVRGEGAGCFLIKPLRQAEMDGDAIHGVVLAYGENHGGRAASLTAPNSQAQTALLLETYVGDLAQEVSYIETHGTGTLLGDPIEMDALQSAWSSFGRGGRSAPIKLGSVKTNVGHLEPAAGVASLAKVLMAMKHRTLPANRHFRKLNPAIKLDPSQFEILAEPQVWSGGRLVAGISSFGFGGSNAHIVVGEPPRRSWAAPRHETYLVTISARTEFSLLTFQNELRLHLERALAAGEEIELEDVAYTLNVGRAHFRCRRAWVVGDLQDLASRLAEADPDVRAVDRELKSRPLGALHGRYLAGEELDWFRLHEGERNRRIHLPTYRFEKKPFWFDQGRSAWASSSSLRGEAA